MIRNGEDDYKSKIHQLIILMSYQARWFDNHQSRVNCQYQKQSDVVKSKHTHTQPHLPPARRTNILIGHFILEFEPRKVVLWFRSSYEVRWKIDKSGWDKTSLRVVSISFFRFRFPPKRNRGLLWMINKKSLWDDQQEVFLIAGDERKPHVFRWQFFSCPWTPSRRILYQTCITNSSVTKKTRIRGHYYRQFRDESTTRQSGFSICWKDE